MNRFRQFVYSLLAICSLAVCGVPVFAEDTFTAAAPTITSLVDTSSLQSNIISQAASWVGIGLAVALSLALVYIGYRLLKRFIGK